VASVELNSISKSFGRVAAVRDVSLSIAEREFVVFVGPSGCGKSTLLRMIAGLEEIDGGELLIGGRLMNRVPAADRGIAMVFQSYALYPHMSVAENMGFALKMLGVGKAEVEAKVRAAAETLKLMDLLDRKPRQLSGGQRQRVAIGRAITRSPDVFLFDEPLSNLDADLRAQMRVEIARLHDELKTTMIYVTHDQVEAMTLADRIVILNDGLVEQEGAPLDLYERPANLFVAGFLGQPKMNLIAARAERAGAASTLQLPSGRCVGTVRSGADGPVTIGLRPDAILLASEGGLPATVELVERLGNSTLVHTRVEGLPGLVVVDAAPGERVSRGDTVSLRIDETRIHLFGQDGRALA
jgi:ABC-type sugar transport system ATPase subunit